MVYTRGSVVPYPECLGPFMFGIQNLGFLKGDMVRVYILHNS